MANKMPKAPEGTQEITRCLEVVYTAKRIREMGADLAQRELELSSVTAKAKEVAAGYRAQRKEIQSTIDELARAIDSGKGSEDVPCERRPNWEQNCWDIWRMDTKEVVDTEPMTAADRQASMQAVK